MGSRRIPRLHGFLLPFLIYANRGWPLLNRGRRHHLRYLICHPQGPWQKNSCQAIQPWGKPFLMHAQFLIALSWALSLSPIPHYKWRHFLPHGYHQLYGSPGWGCFGGQWWCEVKEGQSTIGSWKDWGCGPSQSLRKRISIELKLDTNENYRRDSRTRASKNYATMCCSRQQEGAWSVFIIGQFAMKQCMIENSTHRLFIQYAAHHWDARRWQWGWIFGRVSQTPMIGRDDQESFEQNIQGIVWFCMCMSG